MSSSMHSDRLAELLVQRAIDGTLSAQERMELKQLLEQEPQRADEIDEAAAAGEVEDGAEDVGPRGGGAGAGLEAAQAAEPSTRRVFCGHVHHQRLYYTGRGRALMEFTPQPGVAVPVSGHRRWLATVGSVGQPRDGDVRAMYALFDATQQRLAFHRVAYDHRAAAAAIRRTPQPAWYAQRLEEGR